MHKASLLRALSPPDEWEMTVAGSPPRPRCAPLDDVCGEGAVLDLWPPVSSFVVLYLESGINPQMRAILAGAHGSVALEALRVVEIHSE